jgi:hypothetical protein
MNKLEDPESELWDALTNITQLPEASPDPGPSHQHKLVEPEMPTVQDLFEKKLQQAAKSIFLAFERPGVIDVPLFSMRAAIIGPSASGKTRLFTAVAYRVLEFLVHRSGFKSHFLVSIDFRRKEITTAEEFYGVVTEAVIDSLLIQRRDMQLFGTSLRKAFAVLPTIDRMKRLPKPLSFQDYLRRPLKDLDLVLEQLHRNYHDPALIEAFLTSVAVLPQTIARIFGFRETLYLIDHIDCVDIDIKLKGRRPLPLFEFVKFGLSQAQYLISCVAGEQLPEKLSSLEEDSVDLASNTVFISVFGRVQSEFEDSALGVEIECARPSISKITVTSKHTGGAPAYVEQFNEICERLSEIQGDSGHRKEQLKVNSMMANFLHQVMDFDVVGELVAVKDVRFETKRSAQHFGK